MTNIISLDFEQNPLEKLYAMRRKYDEGGYTLLIVVGIDHDGRRNELEMYPRESYSGESSVVAHLRVGGAGPLEALDQMRRMYDRGGYAVYMAFGVLPSGVVEEVTVLPPGRYRLLKAS